jgi:hypothetical protein
MQHPMDPEAPHRACDALGRLLAQGLLSRAECLDALSHAARATEGDRRGFRTRLGWDLLDAARGWRRARRWAAERVEAALEPGLDARAARSVLLAAARRADRGGALTEEEREAIALAAVRRRLRGGVPAWTGRGRR